MLESGTVTAVAVAVTALVTALMAVSARREAHKTQKVLEDKATFDAAVQAKYEQDKIAEREAVDREATLRRRITDELLAKATEIKDETREIKHQTNGMASKQEEHIQRLEAQIKHLEEIIQNRDTKDLAALVRAAVADAMAKRDSPA